MATMVLSMMIGGTCYASNENNDNQPNSVAQLINQKRVTLNLSNKSLRHILNEIKSQSGIGFVLNDNILDESLKSLSIKVGNVTVKDALNILLKNTSYESVIIDNVITISKKKVAEKQKESKKITAYGRVVDGEDRKSVIGATVLLKETTVGAITDEYGKFKFEVEPGQTIEISFVGMQSQDVVVKDGAEIIIVLKKDAMVMDDVVVTGQNDIRRSSYTGNAVVVKRDELLKVSKTNVIKALQTFDPSFRIKENNTWGSNPNVLPEMYIRGESGIGTKQLDRSDISKSNLKENPNLPTFIMDGFEISAETLYDFDPNRIESITILKDAAATALYGSRAANGVVVITTVVPKPGKLNIAYNFTSDITFPDLTDYDLLNAKEKLELERKAGFYDPANIAANSTDTEYSLQKEYYSKLQNITEGVDTYWLSQPLQTVFNHKHSLSVDGGNETLRFGIDVQYSNQDGVMKGSLRDKMSAGINLQYTYKTLTIKNQAYYHMTRAEESPYGNFADFGKQLPYDKFRDENGRFLEKMPYWGSGTESNKINPLYEPSLHNFDKNNLDELINNLSVNWKITEDLLLKAQLGVSKQMENGKRFFDPLSKQSGNINILTGKNMSSGTLYKNDNDSFSVDFKASLAYNKNINNHAINAFASIEMNNRESNRNSITFIGFPSGTLSSPMYAKEVYKKGSFSENKTRMASFMGSINYSFADTYMLDASLRYDGSSAFGTDNRFAPFWSFGAGINIHKYQFIQDLGFIDQLKVRGSMGQTGKANFPAYAARTSFIVLTDEWYKTGYGASLQALGNSKLKWETTNKYDVGLEITLFKNKLYVKASYYKELTVDLINDVTVPTSTGFSTYRDNIGEVSNTGYELNLRYEAIRTKDFNLVINANMARNKNRIEKISESLKAYNNRVKDLFDKQYIYDDPDQQLTRLPFIQYEEGGSMSSIWGVHSKGINPADGTEVFLSRSGEIVRQWDSSDQIVLGTKEPKGRGAFGFNLSYKQFNLYTSFMYQFGGQEYNSTLVEKVEDVNVYTHNVDRRVSTDRWVKAGDVAKYTSLKTERTGRSYTKPTSRFVQDYSTLSLSSIELSYDLTPEITQKIGMSLVRFSVGMNDIFHLSTVKMERGLSYPFARSVNFSVRISF